jgi:hypothetical protein
MLKEILIRSSSNSFLSTPCGKNPGNIINFPEEGSNVIALALIGVYLSTAACEDIM